MRATPEQLKVITDATSKSLIPDKDGNYTPWDQDSPENKAAKDMVKLLESGLSYECRKGVKLEKIDYSDHEKASQCKWFGANDAYATLDEPIITAEDIKTRPTAQRLEEIASLHGLEIYWERGKVSRKYPGREYIPLAHAEPETKRIRLDPSLKEFTYEGLSALAHEILHFYFPKHERTEYTNIRTGDYNKDWLDIHPMDFSRAEMLVTADIEYKVAKDRTALYDKYAELRGRSVSLSESNKNFVDELVEKAKAKKEQSKMEEKKT